MSRINFEQEFPHLQPHLTAIAEGLQRLIVGIFPDAEVTCDGENAGYGFGSRYKDLVFVITPHSKHVNLGIINGAALDDPHGLMAGKGKVHRHVKVYRLEDVNNPKLDDLMVRAFQATQERYEK